MKPLFYVFIIIFLSSCGLDNINTNIYEATQKESLKASNYYENEMFEPEDENINLRAEKIGNYLLKFDNVSNVSVIINGKFCIVALEPTQDMSEKDLLLFKRNIANKTKEFDNLIKYATVTTAPDLIEKSKDIANFKSSKVKIEEKEDIENILPEDVEEEIINITPLL